MSKTSVDKKHREDAAAPAATAVVPRSRHKSNKTTAKRMAARRPRPQEQVTSSKTLPSSSSSSSVVAVLPMESKSLSSSANKPRQQQQQQAGPLSEDDVRAIFDSIHHNKKAPPHLVYQVVPVVVGSKRGRLAPPSLDFPEGLHILCDIHEANVPNHVRALGRQTHDPPPPFATALRWNTSGPRLLRPSHAFKVRSCSAVTKLGHRTNHDKNGSMYTMIVDGKEDLQYRLFCLYPSPTSAGNAKLEHSQDIRRKRRVAKATFDGCEVCGTQDNLDCLMECSGCCERFCHTSCIGLTAVPDGDWFCSSCLPRTSTAMLAGGGGDPNHRKRPAQCTLPHQTTAVKKGHHHSFKGNSGTFAESDASEVTHALPRGHGNRKGRAKRVVSPTSDLLSQPSLDAANSTLRQSNKATNRVHYKLVCQKKNQEGDQSVKLDDHLGFLILEGRDSTFADVRVAIRNEIDPTTKLLADKNWKFALPSLGPISYKQEELLGPAPAFLDRAFSGRLGNGSADTPYLVSLFFA